MEQVINKKRILRGIITSDKMMSTVVVRVERLIKHPKYKKFIKVSRKFKAHNPENQFHTGEKVLIQETRPMSKEKRWIVVGKI